MGSNESNSNSSDTQDKLKHIAAEVNKSEAQKTREKLEVMFTIPGYMKNDGINHPDNLIGIADCSVVERYNSGRTAGKSGKWRLYRIGEHGQGFRLELEAGGVTHFHEFSAHHIRVNGELNRLVFTQHDSS